MQDFVSLIVRANISRWFWFSLVQLLSPFPPLRSVGTGLSLVSSASVGPVGSAPRPRPGAMKQRHAEKVDKHGPWCARQGPSWSPRQACRTPTPSASWSFSRAGVNVDDAGAVMGANPLQMRGAVLGRLKAEFSLVAMKAGCMRAFEALRGGAGAAVPPPLAAFPPGMGSALPLPPLAATSAPVVQAVAVSAGGGSYAGVLGGGA